VIVASSKLMKLTAAVCDRATRRFLIPHGQRFETRLRLPVEMPIFGRSSDELHRRYSEQACARGAEIAGTLAVEADVRGKRALDVGCGEGGVAVAFAQRGSHVVAIDNSEDNVRKTAQLLAGFGDNTSVAALRMDAHELAFSDTSFDVVVLADLLEHVSDPQRVATEVVRLLRPGGLLYVSVPNKLSLWCLVRDQHYQLFGLTLMPHAIAGFYVTKVRKRAAVYAVESTFRFGTLRKLFDRHGIRLRRCTHLRSLSRLEDPETLIDPVQRRVATLLVKLGLRGIVKRLMLTRFYQTWISPGVICIARKPQPE